MQSSALKYAIWLTHFILISLVISLFLLLTMHYYYAYAFNSLFKIEMLNIEVYENPGKNLINLKIGVLALANSAAIYVFWLVRKVLIRIKDDGPFDPMIVNSLRRILNIAIIVVLLNFVASFVIDLFLGKLQFSISTSTLIIVFLISIVFVMIEILKYGIMIREEQRLTI